MSQGVAAFGDLSSADIGRIGGKGLNLTRMAHAGFPVPPGFIVTTDAYRTFLATSGIEDDILRIARMIDYGNAEGVEAATAEIRRRIVGADVPQQLADGIERHYRELGEDIHVAVRSSGTAEDLDEASFAGLHDTYLDIAGRTALLDAVKRCWASMWTARAAAYRHDKGFDHAKAMIAVVVQKMVDARVAGVMFTANPLTEITEEYVVNASWGLGEAVVSGIVDPDEYVIDANSHRVTERKLGAKEVEVVRDPVSGIGTVSRDTAPTRRSAYCLDDDALTSLATLGEKVMRHYDGLPQDIEWAQATDGTLYLLQSRPITGADFFWGEDLEYWQQAPEQPGTVWTRSWADEVWNGAITPLMYTWRADMFSRAAWHSARFCGVGEIADENEIPRERAFKFYRSEAYFNSRIERLMVEHTTLPIFRSYPHAMDHVVPQWHDEVKAAPLSLGAIIDMHQRIMAFDGARANTPYRFLEHFDEWYAKQSTEAAGLTDDAIRALDDAALKDYIRRSIQFEIDFTVELWFGFYVYTRDAFCGLGWMLGNWYGGDAVTAMGDLLSGTPVRTATAIENIELWQLAQKIRSSPALRKIFDANEGAAFFSHLEESVEGREFLAVYRCFVQAHPHRGHEDRDIYHPRRCEDPTVDYRAFQALLGGDVGEDPEVREAQVTQRRNAVIAQIAEDIRKQPLGGLKAELFLALMDWMLRFLVMRDNLRYLSDRSCFAAKRGYLELSRRLMERKQVETATDFYFLGQKELFEFFDGNANPVLAKAKITARRRDFERFRSGQAKLPAYLQHNRPADFSVNAGREAEHGVLPGKGTSRGSVTGIARVVRNIHGIGQVRPGEILVTHSTDPGWTPVFLIISGIVLETGGMLAHGSLLAREYGLPAVQLPDAISLIPDGAHITVDGDTGKVTVHEPATA